jgi:hypothetical protein
VRHRAVILRSVHVANKIPAALRKFPIFTSQIYRDIPIWTQYFSIWGMLGNVVVDINQYFLKWVGWHTKKSISISRLYYIPFSLRFFIISCTQYLHLYVPVLPSFFEVHKRSNP